LELAGRMGIEGLLEGMDATKDHAERAVRAALASIRPGIYRFEDVLDDDGAGTFDIPIRVAVTIGDGSMLVDFAGPSRRVGGGVTVPLAVTRSACAFVLRAVPDPEIPSNAGADRPLEVRAEPGSLLNPEPPAAVAAGNVETSQRIVDVVLGALAPA